MKVIITQRVEQEAYEMGYERFDRMDPVPADGFDLSGFQGSATYANHVLPSLRALAGFEDTGHGTYQQNQTVALVDEADLEDNPIDADETMANEYFQTLMDEWRAGAYDAGTEET